MSRFCLTFTVRNTVKSKKVLLRHAVLQDNTGENWHHGGLQIGDRLAGGPLHLASTQDVDVQVVDRLASIWSIIDDDPVASVQAFFLSTCFCNHDQVAQQLVDAEDEYITLKLKCTVNTVYPHLITNICGRTQLLIKRVKGSI